MTPDQIHDYEYQLRSAVHRLEGDEAIRPQDRKLISSFLKHKAKELSLGMQAKHVNHLRTIAHNMSVRSGAPRGGTLRSSSPGSPAMR